MTSDGYAVRGAAGAPVTLQNGRAIDISSDGTIRQDGAVVGQLELADFTSHCRHREARQQLLPRDRSGRCARARRPEPPSSRASSKLQHRQLPKSAVRLVSVMRQFEMLQKAVTLGADMNRQRDRASRQSR